MTGHRCVLVVLALVGTAACVGGTDTPAVTVWEAQLSADLAHPDVAGQAAAVSDPSGTALSVLITGAEPGATHAWGLMTGSCAVPGSQIGPAGDYPALVVDDMASAEANTHLGPRLSPDQGYFIEIRLSPSDAARVACGDLTPR